MKVGDMPIVEDPNPRRQRIEQCPVMTDKQNGALKIGERVFQRFDRFDIEMIRWLVEQEKVGAAEHHHRERNTRLFTT